MTMTDEDFFDTVKKAQGAAMSESVSCTMLYGIAYKTGRTSTDLLLDYVKAHTILYRDQVMAISFSVVCEILLKTGVSAEAKLMIMGLLDLSMTEAKTSQTRFSTLHDHLRQEHKEEILNELQRTSQCPKP